ncbi:MAG: tetratricopeptide repeat protein [Deltaproteobacteria bacterium]|nr:tetratricopeptide repeat protein [Deltaproteobacteria bacterium]
MWPRATFLKWWGGLLVCLLTASGCGVKSDPYGQQVKRVEDYSVNGKQHLSQGDLKRAGRDFHRALDLSRGVDYQRGVAAQLNNLGAVALEQGDLKKARQLFTQAWEVNRDSGHWADAATNQANLATVAMKEGRPDQAAQHLALAEDAARRSEAKGALVLVWSQLAGLALDQNDPARARTYLEQAQALNQPDLKGALHYGWGRLFLLQGNTAEALRHLTLALEADKAALDLPAMAADLFLLGQTYQRRAEFDQAFTHYARAFEVYAALKKTAGAQKCRERLREVNIQGRLGRPLERFEEHPLFTPAKKTPPENP